MAIATAAPPIDVVRTADGTPLKARLRQTERVRNTAAFGLILPLLAFTLVFFFFPIFSMLVQSFENKEIPANFPRAIVALKSWGGQGLPGEDAYAALAYDLKHGYDNKTVPRAAVRLNYEIAQFRSMVLASARKAANLQTGPYKEAMIGIDARWGEREYWAVLKRNSSTVTDHYFLNALDLERNVDQEIVKKAEDRRIYISVLFRTFWISLFVTILCLLLGYPVAYLLATQPARISNLLMIFVLLPFWTSLLVRTVAWVVLLQQQGLLNDLMIALGLIKERVLLVFNRPGLLIAMTHVLLPFMILPIYSVMKGIDPQYMRAAKSLGASPALAFATIYIPLTFPGIGAGVLLVFILAIGYYITPELVGGGGDQMISHFIAIYTSELVNWGQGSALAVILLAAVLALYAIYARFFKLSQI
ncbi:MAG: ABC transporter permease [Rhodospirillales bacterium]|nr:ABC transporter permease [Rhodospirillales bacterium]